MRVVAFITEPQVIDRILDHFRRTAAARRRSPAPSSARPMQCCLGGRVGTTPADPLEDADSGDQVGPPLPPSPLATALTVNSATVAWLSCVLVDSTVSPLPNGGVGADDLDSLAQAPITTPRSGRRIRVIATVEEAVIMEPYVWGEMYCVTLHR